MSSKVGHGSHEYTCFPVVLQVAGLSLDLHILTSSKQTLYVAVMQLQQYGAAATNVQRRRT